MSGSQTPTGENPPAKSPADSRIASHPTSPLPAPESSPDLAKTMSHIIAAQIETSRSMSISSGPLPPPETLKEYEAALPGAAKRIFAMVEKQMDHRMSLETKVTNSEFYRSYAGMACGLIVALACVIGGLVVIGQGHDAAGATVATTTVVSLTGIFVYGSITRQHERKDKARIMAKAETAKKE